MTDLQHISIELSNMIAQVDEFKGKWIKLKEIAPDRLVLLRKVATIASVGASTRIEGSQLTDVEVEHILSRLEKKQFQSRDEEEVAGYADAMNLVFDSFEDIPVTENYIKQLHSILLKYSSKDQNHKGEYKKFPNNLEAFDPTGKSLGIVFKTTEPFDTPFQMKELIEWHEISLKENRYHPLLVIAIFIVRFLAIHPFQDGNGRLSRVLTTLMLLQAGYAYVPYCSLESIVEENKEQYYRSLRKAQKTLDTDNSELESWLIFFVKMLKKQKTILEERVEKERLRSEARLPELSASILTVVQEQKQVTISELAVLTGSNRNTLKKHVQALVRDQYLELRGKRKGAYYTRKS